MALKTLNRRNKKDLKWPKIIIASLSTIGIVDTGSIDLNDSVEKVINYLKKENFLKKAY